MHLMEHLRGRALVQSNDLRREERYARVMDAMADALSVINEMTVRWNAKDAAGFAELFSADADFTDVLGQTAHGRQEIEAQHRFPFTRTLRAATLSVDRIEARPLGSDVVVALVPWAATGNLGPDDAPLPERAGKMHVVLQRTGGAWLIASVLNQDPTGIYRHLMPEGSGFKSTAT